MRIRTIMFAFLSTVAIAVSLSIATPAQAADRRANGPTFTVYGARCHNSVHMYTSSGYVVAVSTIVCSKRFPTMVSEINISRRNPSGIDGNQRWCTGNPSGCSSSVRMRNPSGSQLFGAHANCVLDVAGLCRYGWGANVSFRA
jgi:hypothetical protein